MPSPLARHVVVRASRHVPGLKRLPVLKLLVVGEIAMLAHSHITRLSPEERRRFVILMRDARGRPSALPISDRYELQELVAKAEPRLFAAIAADRLSPVPLPVTLLSGKRRSERRR
jgi:hypothetical protein